MRSLLLALLFTGCVWLPAVPASGDEGGATYQRGRQQAGAHHGGGFHGGGFRHPGNWGWGWGGFYNPPIVVGSYYQRPYPTHLDFFRLRQRTPLVVPYADCPTCNTPVIVEPAQ